MLNLLTILGVAVIARDYNVVMNRRPYKREEEHPKSEPKNETGDVG